MQMLERHSKDVVKWQKIQYEAKIPTVLLKKDVRPYFTRAEIYETLM